MKKFLPLRLLYVCTAIVLLLLVSMGVFRYRVYRANNTERVLNCKSTDRDDYVSLWISSADGWKKQMTDGFAIPPYFDKNGYSIINDDGFIETYGRTYDFIVNNLSQADITNWYVEIVTSRDVYLNKSWTGDVKIFQNNSQSVQSFNAMTVKEGQLEIDYCVVDNLFLFPVEKGGVIRYYPSESFLDNSIVSGDKKTFGMILYTDEENVSFGDVRFCYTVKENIKKMKSYYVILYLIILFFLIDALLLVQVVLILRYEKKRSNDKKIIVQAIGTFSRFIDSKDSYTQHHSLRVGHLSRMIATHLGMSEDEVDNVFYIGLLHDVGKVAVPEGILKKPGRLTEDEYSVIKTHTRKGADILKDFTAIKGISDGALYHHERYDGNGYMDGLKGDEIPLVARIICVADAYDAMNSTRCYRKNLSDETVLSELKKNSGTQFDPKIVDVFIHCIHTGEVAEVCRKIQEEVDRYSLSAEK